jgi:Methylase involved in ubiquinone/menaquinone biosynthesis
MRDGRDRSEGSGAAAVAIRGMRERDVISAYARWAPVYDAVFGPVMDGARKHAVAALPPGTGRVLEVGVGTGISLPYYPDGVRVTGIDLSPHMLEIARRRIVRKGLSHVEAVKEMDASAMTFASASFDAAMAMYVMTVVPDPGRVFAEIRRVVRPGGRVLVLGHFAADSGLRVRLGHAVAPLCRALGWNSRITASFLAAAPGLRFVGERAAGLFGFYRLLEFEVMADEAATTGAD